MSRKPSTVAPAFKQVGEASGTGAPRGPAGRWLRYRPIWNVQQKMMNIHLCETAAGPAADGTQDSALLAQVLGDLGRAPPARGLGSVCIPVQYDTLAAAAARQAFVARCDAVPADLRELLIWEIAGTPEAIDERSLFSMVSTLKPYGRAVLVRCRLDRSDFEIAAAVGVHSAGVDLAGSAASETEMARALERFAEQAHRVGLRCHVHGLATSSICLAAFSCGFDYLAGPAVSETDDTPWAILPFDAEHLFLTRRRADA